MRFKITLKSEKPNFLLNFNYNHTISSILYNKIIDLDLSRELHETNSFKFFTFSQINIPKIKVTKKGLISKDGLLNFFVSSPNDYLIKNMIQGYVDEPYVNFRNNILNVEKIELLENKNFTEKEEFKTISPILVRTKRKIDGELKSWDLEPCDEFFNNLRYNLIKKYLEFNQIQKTEKNIKIYSKMRNVKSRRIKIKSGKETTFHRAYLMDLVLEGDLKLIEFAYDVGLGNKGSMGFGMIEIL